MNYYSPLTFFSLNNLKVLQSSSVLKHYPKRFWCMVAWGMQYCASNILHPWRYPYYKHHRKLDFSHVLIWFKAFLRYPQYQISEYFISRSILKVKDKKYFLVPLQVPDDAQMVEHCDYECIEEFIKIVIHSFSGYVNSGKDQKEKLIIKHHPMSRGHVNYKKFIFSLAKQLGIVDRVIYVHDFPLPLLLPKLKSCVTVNSTLGLQALAYGVPVIALGRCFYNKRGLTYQANLDSFWSDPGSVDLELFEKYKAHVIATSQINGCLYSGEYEIQ